jgi:hypothetical protein
MAKKTNLPPPAPNKKGVTHSSYIIIINYQLSIINYNITPPPPRKCLFCNNLQLLFVNTNQALSEYEL